MGDTGPVLPSCPQSCGGLSHGSGQVPLTQSAPPCWARGEVKLCGLDAPRPLDPSLAPRRLSSALCPALPPRLWLPPGTGLRCPPPLSGTRSPSPFGPLPRPPPPVAKRTWPPVLPQCGASVSFPTASPPARGCAAGRRTVRRSALEAPGPRAGGGPGSPRAEQLGGRLCPRPRPSGRHGERGRRGRPGRALPDGEVRGRCASGCQPRCSENSHRLLVPTDRTWRRSHSHRPGTVPPHARPREPGPRDEAPRLRDVRVPRGGHSAALGGGGPWGPGLHAERGKGWCPHGQKPLSEDRGDMGGATGQESEIRRTDV